MPKILETPQANKNNDSRIFFPNCAQEKIVDTLVTTCNISAFLSVTPPEAPSFSNNVVQNLGLVLARHPLHDHFIVSMFA